MIIWHWALRESFLEMQRKRRISLSLAVTLLWCFLMAAMFTADPSLKRLGNFSHDPVVNFFKQRRIFFPLTMERVFALQRDRKYEKFMRPKIPRIRNIVLVVVDALRADHLPVYGYSRPITPFLSSFLAKTPHQKVDLVLSNGFDTLTGLQCLLTSKDPWTVSSHNYTLPDYLSDSGFQCLLALAGGHTWQKENKTFGKNIDYFYDGGDHPGPDGICDDRTALNGLSDLQPDDGGFHFIYVHLISVHQLALLHSPFALYAPVLNLRNQVFSTGAKTPEDFQNIKNMYDDRIFQMDDSLKKVFAILAQKGYLKDYVGVLTADHGQLLGEKGRYGHGFYASLGGMWIPLVFFSSHPLPKFQQPHFGVQVDIAPTLTDLAGMGYATCWQGQSLLKPRINPWSLHCSVQHWQGREGP